MRTKSTAIRSITPAGYRAAEAYCILASDATGREYVPGARPKWNVHFNHTGEQCAEAGYDPMDWCQLIFTEYARINGPDRIPYPNQLHGETAALMVGNALARARPPTIPNRYRTPEEDEA